MTSNTTNIYTKASILLLIALLIQSCITIRVNDDGSRFVEDASVISAFELSEVGKKQNYKSQESISFQVVDAKKLNEIKSLKEKTWVFVWGSWCAPCLEKIPKLIEIERQNKDLNVILVAEDYDLEILQKILFKNDYDKIAYLLDSEQYGTKTGEKIKLLQQDLCFDMTFLNGFPQNYFYTLGENKPLYLSGAVANSVLDSLGIQF